MSLIAAYIYRADIICDDCIVEMVVIDNALESQKFKALPEIAKFLGIDYDDQRSYDSDRFPKPVLSMDLDGDEFCGYCSDPIE